MSAVTDDLSKSRILMMEGYAPQVTVTNITGGHKITITDINHPEGQSFNVYDGDGKDVDVFLSKDLAMTDEEGGGNDVTAAQIAAMLEAGRRVRCIWDYDGDGSRYYAYPHYSWSQGTAMFSAYVTHNNKLCLALLDAQEDYSDFDATYYPLE